MREYVSATAYGIVPANTDEIVVCFYGPRGGLRSAQGISVESAQKLRDDLDTAIKKFSGGGNVRPEEVQGEGAARS